MSHDFKLKYDQLKNNDPTKKEGANNYELQSNVRNICFVQPNGNSVFLNYGYLVSGEHLPNENRIILYFTSHVISLIGFKLDTLYQDLMKHLPQMIICKEERYNELSEGMPVINLIEIEKV